MAAMTEGVLVILALTLLTPYFYYIPKATLSSVIISAVIFMIEIGTIRPIWRCNKRDLIPALATFLACLFVGVELGILIGSVIDLAILIYLNARPAIYVEYKSTSTTNYVLVRPSAGLLFPAMDYLRIYLTQASSNKCQSSLKNSDEITNVVLDCEHIDKIDFTAAQGISTMMEDFRNNNRQLIMLQPNPDILNSIQSLLNKPILSARNDNDLIVIFNELKKDKARFNQDTNIEIEISNHKIVSETTDEFTITKL